MRNKYFFLMIVLASSICYAGSDFVTRSKLGDLQYVNAVTVKILRPHMESDIPKSETDLKNGGCTYSARSAKDILDMVEILKSANIQPNRGRQWGAGPITGIYLKSANGPESRLLMNQDFSSLKQAYGSFNGAPVTTNSSLPAALYQWAARMQIDPKCEDFIGIHRFR
jgi:hypothetical protein